MAVFFAYCRIVATDIHFIACMRYRRGRPKGVPLWGFRKMLCRENAICRPRLGSFYELRVTRSDVVSLSLSPRSRIVGAPRGAPATRAEGFPKRRCQFESVAAQRHLSPRKKPWLIKPCLMDLLCISPFIRSGPPFGTAPTQAPVGAFLRAEGYSKRCCQFEFVAAQRHLSPSEPLTADG